MHIEVTHPCVRHKMAKLRAEDTGHKRFRELATEITMFVCYEVLKKVKLKPVVVKTPIAETVCHEIADDVVIVPILRAGVGMLDGILELIPTARVGFVGLYRDEETTRPVEYYKKFPPDTQDALYIVVDPMIATGGSTVATLDMLKQEGITNVVVVCIVTCPEGLEAIANQYPNVPVYAASVDEGLNEKNYIVPGLGDAGDRLFGTR